MTRGAVVKRAAALAHPNIALAKYWGKREGAGNYPAVPSLSVTLAGLATRTSVAFRDDLRADTFVLDGRPTQGAPLARVTELLDRVRTAAGTTARAEVASANDFPTASGLASSASGFAALALAATRAAGLDWDASQVSDLARRSSASAARSLFGGFVELDAGPLAPRGDEVLAARPVAPAHALDVAVLVCVTTEQAKDVASGQGMRTTAQVSPFYPAWLEQAPRLTADLRDALLVGDVLRAFELAEASALAMHACALAAGVIYVRGPTLEVLTQVRALRAGGLPAYATIDAGPHVKVLVRGTDAPRAAARLAAIPGVLRVLDARPGPGAQVLPVGDA